MGWVFEYARPLCLLDVDIFGTALVENRFNSVYELDHSYKYYKFVNGRQYRRQDDLLSYTQEITGIFKRNDHFLDDLVRNIKRASKKLSRKSEYIVATNWDQSSTEVLTNEWIDFCEAVLPVGASLLMLPSEFLQEQLHSVLDLLRKRQKREESIEKLISIINNAVDPLTYREEPLDLLRIGSVIQQDPYLVNLFEENNPSEIIYLSLSQELKDKISDHLNNYSWLNLPYSANRSPFVMSDYIERLRHLITRSNCNNEISRIHSLRKTDQEQFRNLLKTTLSKQESSLLNGARDFTYLQTDLDIVFDHSLWKARDTLLKEIRIRLGLSDDQVASMTIKEVRDSIIRSLPIVSIDQLNARLNGFAYIIEGNETIIATGDEILPYSEAPDLNQLDSLGNQTFSVKGMIANEGVAIGPVRILLNVTDNAKVMAGDIIITSMTTPEYISSMEKAAAFVTDEGGVICHAAIHSREFNVPCIVGTGNATQIFKDNEIVRVDAYSGVVQRV